MHKPKQMLISLLLIFITVYLVIGLFIFLKQDALVFHPSRNMQATPEDAGLDYRSVSLASGDETIHGWYIEHKQPLATLLFLHGNAGNISHRLDTLKIFHQLGLSVLILDYQGYGESTGKPSEQNCYEDARAGWKYLTETLHIHPENMVIFGRSLGGAVAVQLATEVQAGALIIESSFTSIADMGKHYYPYLPIRWFNRIHFDSLQKIQNIHTPLLVLHSEHDDIVPYSQGQQLFHEANEPREFVTIEGDHNQGFLMTGRKYTDALAQFLQHIFTH